MRRCGCGCGLDLDALGLRADASYASRACSAQASRLRAAGVPGIPDARKRPHPTTRRREGAHRRTNRPRPGVTTYFPTVEHAQAVLALVDGSPRADLTADEGLAAIRAAVDRRMRRATE